MNGKLLRLTAALLSLSVLQLACYNRYSIPTDELERLQSGNIAEYVTVETGEGPISVRATTPIFVETVDGARHSISPFNFALSEQQLVAPDYDLLLARNDITGARVSQFNKGRTIGLVVGAIVAAGGAFATFFVLGGEEEQ